MAPFSSPNRRYHRRKWTPRIMGVHCSRAYWSLRPRSDAPLLVSPCTSCSLFPSRRAVKQLSPTGGVTDPDMSGAGGRATRTEGGMIGNGKGL